MACICVCRIIHICRFFAIQSRYIEGKEGVSQLCAIYYHSSTKLVEKIAQIKLEDFSMGRRLYFYLKETRQRFSACSEIASELDAAEQLLRRRFCFVEPKEP